MVEKYFFVFFASIYRVNPVRFVFAKMAVFIANFKRNSQKNAKKPEAPYLLGKWTIFYGSIWFHLLGKWHFHGFVFSNSHFFQNL